MTLVFVESFYLSMANSYIYLGQSNGLYKRIYYSDYKFVKASNNQRILKYVSVYFYWKKMVINSI